jgi:hypothetical protein
MARKSGWQQFSDNFNSVYGTFNKLGQQIETKKLMDDDEFTKPGGLGYDGAARTALTGSALERARYKALGDIATKYGDTAGGLANRTALANLDAQDRQNRMDEKNFDTLTEIQGLLAKQALMANTGLTSAQTKRIQDMTPVEIKNLEQNIKSSEAAITRDDSLADNTVALGTQSIEDSKNQNASRSALTDNTVGLGTQSIEDSKNQNASRSALTDNTVGLGNASIASTTESTEAQKLLNDEAKAKAVITTELGSLMTTVTSANYETEELAQEAYITAVLESDKIPYEVKLQTQETVMKFGLNKLVNTAVKLGKEADAAFANGGVDGFVKWYDTVDDSANGKTTLTFMPTDTGFALVSRQEQGEKVVQTELYRADGEESVAKATIGDMLMNQVKDPGTSLSTAASVIDMDSKSASTDEAASRTALNEQNIASMISASGLNGVKAEKLAAEIESIKNTIENSDQKDTEKTKEQGLQKFLSGDTYAFMVEDNPQLAANLLAGFKFNTGMLNMAAIKESGLTLDEYLAMTPADQAAFN